MSTQGLGASMRPHLAAARQPGKSLLDEAIAATVQRGGIDLDLLHAMDSADESLIADEVVNGVKSGAFVYSFDITGSGTVTGISVIGAAHLARKYGGLKHRMVASIEKRGALHIFRSYPDNGVPMHVSTSILPDLEEDSDYYTAVVEMTDIKTGNSIQVEKTETRVERRRDKTTFERPHYQTIAQSKAYRNAVLRLVPQDIQRLFMAECLTQGKSKNMTSSLIDEKRNGVLAFAVKHSIPVARDQVFALGMAEISGLSDAVREDGLAAFVNACKAVGLISSEGDQQPNQPAAATSKPKTDAKPEGGKQAARKGGADQKPPKSEPEAGEAGSEKVAAGPAAKAEPPVDDDDGLFGAT